MATIITVHGTNAGAESDSGSAWWQRNSAFHRNLTARFSQSRGTPNWVPFHWSGANSEEARRHAGHRLLDLLTKDYEEEGKPYSLIGHSHGGSVILEALRQAQLKGQELRHLDKWVTIGSPFLNFRRNRFLISRLTVTDQVFLFLLFLGTFLAITYAIYNASANIPPYFVIPQMIVIFLLYRFFIGRQQAKLRARYHIELNRDVSHQYGDKWVSLWDRDDEAINVIANAIDLKPDIAPRGLLAGPLRMLAFLVILISLGVSVVQSQSPLSLRETPGDLIYPLPPDARVAVNEIIVGSVAQLGDAFGGNKVVEITLQWAAALALVGLYFFLTFIFVHFLAVRIIGPVVGNGIDSILSAELRRTAFGNDTIGEYEKSVSETPEGFATRWKALPENIHDQLLTHTSRTAVETLNKLRAGLGIARASSQQMNVTSFVDDLSWGELIHTSYFEIDDIIDQIAVALIETGSLDASSRFSANQKDQASALLAGLRQSN